MLDARCWLLDARSTHSLRLPADHADIFAEVNIMVFIGHPLTHTTSEFNAKTQRRRDAKTAGGTSSSGEVPAAVPRRPATASPNCRPERERSGQQFGPAACALTIAGLASHSVCGWDGTRTLAFEQSRLRRDRRAMGTSAGGKTDSEGCWHPELAGFSTAAGERQITGVSAAPLRATSFTQEPPPLRLCVFFRVRICVICVICGQSAMVAGLCDFAALRLCVFASLRWLGWLPTSVQQTRDPSTRSLPASCTHFAGTSLSLAQDDIPTGLPRSARRHVICGFSGCVWWPWCLGGAVLRSSST